MTNLVLYRKYRPKTFSEIVGQEHVVKTLENALASGLISHAYLFSGPRGSGKTSIARLLAKSLNCQEKKAGEFEPCNKCSSCLEMNEARAIDLIEVDAASNRGIDEIRELREGIRFAPTKSHYKVFIIDEAHQLSKDAANALLKTLEEPPGHAVFILATTEIHKMIPTIISRCQRFDFRKLTLLEIVGHLEQVAKKEGAKIEKPALELIALHSGGAVRDAIGLLDQAITFSGTITNGDTINAQEIQDLLGMVDTKLISEFFEYLSQKKIVQALDFLNKVIEKGKDLQEFAKAVINYLRQGLILKISADFTNPVVVGLSQEEQQKLKLQVANLTDLELRQMLKLFLEAEVKMKYSSIQQLPLELAIIEALQKEAK